MTSQSENPLVAIKIGLKNLSVAVRRHGCVEFVTDDDEYDESSSIPAYVAFVGNEMLFGKEAQKQMDTNTVYDIMMLIGWRYSDPCIQSGIRKWPFRVLPGSNDKPNAVVTYKNTEKQFSPEELLSMLLRNMKEKAENFLKCPVQNVVITIPGYFNKMQRLAVKKACTIASIPALEIIDEPIAVSMAYLMEGNLSVLDESNFLIFHLGGSTFDVSVVNIKDKIRKLKVIVQDSHLGGENFTDGMVKYCIEEFRKKHGMDVRNNTVAMMLLTSACENAKRALSEDDMTKVEIENLFYVADFSCPISRDQFEQINGDLFTKCMDLVKKCLSNAKMEKGSIDKIMLVGGSTKMPKIQTLLRDFFNGKQVCGYIEPQEVVLSGATISDNSNRDPPKMLTPPENNILVKTRNENSFSIGPVNKLEETEHGMTDYAEFSYAELKEATDDFNDDHKIGEGGYGSVYKGVIHCTTLAIKVLNKGSEEQGEREFNQEVTILRNVRHPNLVTLIGGCPEKWALVYEFMPKGNLQDCLSNTKDRESLSWRKRIQIALNICSALVFLHHTKPYGIVHGDLKPANILLDSTYTCKLSDFGTCRRLKLTDTTRTPGHKTQNPSYTMFYCDPEYLESNTITTHSDVFSFGVVLLRLVTGREAMGIRMLVQEALDNGKLNEIVDASANWPLEVAGKLAQLGLCCIERSRKDRPDLATKVWTEIKPLEQVASPS